MKRLLFIINPKAGKTAIKPDLFEIILVFSQAGYEVVTYPTTGPADAERKVIADGADYDIIVCAGGDGTLENTVCGYMKMGEKKVPLGYIPVGTTNDFARSLKISRKPVEAAKQIVNNKVQYIDVGQFGDKYFIYIAAFGMFTDISYSTDQNLKKVMGHSAYVVEAVKNIMNYKAYKIEAELDGAKISGEYIYGMVTNSFSVAGFKLRGTKYVFLDDGKFDCLFIKSPKTTTELQSVVTAMLTNNIDGNEMFFQCKAQKVVINCEEEIPWTLDGEYGGNKKSIEIINHQKSIGLYLTSNYGELELDDNDESANEKAVADAEDAEDEIADVANTDSDESANENA